MNHSAVKRHRIKDRLDDRIFGGFIIFVLIVVNMIMLYPFLFVFSTAISDPQAVIRGQVFLFPKGFSTVAYSQILQYPSFGLSYFNTVFYSIVGTVAALILIVHTAYPLSREKFLSRKMLTFFFVFTMFFSGGMIPTFLVVKGIGLYDSRAAFIIPVLLGAWNIIICKSFFQGIPTSLHESASIDGANELTVLYRIILPLSKPVLATLSLFIMVSYWNNFFSGLLYINDRDKYPLQMILRSILMNAEAATLDPSGSRDSDAMAFSTMSLKSAAVIVTILPILCVYPFIQKYFVKGVMLGSVKG